MALTEEQLKAMIAASATTVEAMVKEQLKLEKQKKKQRRAVRVCLALVVDTTSQPWVQLSLCLHVSLCCVFLNLHACPTTMQERKTHTRTRLAGPGGAAKPRDKAVAAEMGAEGASLSLAKSAKYGGARERRLKNGAPSSLPNIILILSSFFIFCIVLRSTFVTFIAMCPQIDHFFYGCAC